MKIDPILLLGAFVFGSISAYLASKRGKNPLLWFLVGFIFGALGIFAIFLSMPPKKPTPSPTPEPLLSLRGPIDKFWYYIDPSQQQQGPISREALTQAFRKGQVGLSTLIWHEELENWKPLKEVLYKAEPS